MIPAWREAAAIILVVVAIIINRWPGLSHVIRLPQPKELDSLTAHELKSRIQEEIVISTKIVVKYLASGGKKGDKRLR